ncbi:MAG: DUF805 domain-containing protein [Propionibacteriaceae bacterium]|uniref:DUF805 domain-containing protein n=1 Tax=Propionibacterium ruminifibrarum TaxID=1962131 RepID=A0A375I1V5_9ACTN|nr:DUF805 domain-containing protein [Propionibacterium ruminifibrarum]MBE6477494.1 DUF805 domain-containing protein [Propionibacteriaceae bacterium]SPF68804.1 Protein of unknown function (DUF805) [Propionibacterium ruminifibrarum]
MGFGQSIKTVYSKYATFSGRASRSEFWWFILFSFLVNLVFSVLNTIAHTAGIVDPETTTPALFILALFNLGTFIPLLALYARRLHDTGRSAALLLLLLLAGIGSLILLILCALAGQPGPNQYGDDPLGRAGSGYPAQSVPYGGSPYGGQ